VINNWTAHTTATNTSGGIRLIAGQRYEVKVEYYERSGQSVMRLYWQLPGVKTYSAVPADHLYPN
jgi:hypothetical protein